MHLGNSIICPVTGIPMIIAMSALAVWSFKKSKNDFTRENLIKMAVLTVLVFALQMFDFAIPQTGSSGHIIGTILLAVMLGRYRAFLSMCAILVVQAFALQDGGTMALGCNILNMGALGCFVAYPLIYKTLADKNAVFAAIAASVVSLQLGSAGVILEGFISGRFEGNYANFLNLMQSIHFPIGIVEGVFTAAAIIVLTKFSTWTTTMSRR